MTGKSNITPIRPVAEREGEPVLDMSDARDIATLRRALAEGWSISFSRLQEYLRRLDAVMSATIDERVIVAGSGVAVAALRAHTDAAKAIIGGPELHVHNELHVHGGRELPQELTLDELRRLAALDTAEAQAPEGPGAGRAKPHPRNPRGAARRPDANARKGKP